MNLLKLFEMQRVLDKRITDVHPVQEGEDRLANKILALQVELGELANEWRGFKFWSVRQEPVTNDLRVVDYKESGEAILETYNPLLEEYVDCLHFILSIGLELDVRPNLEWDDICHYDDDITNLFLDFNIKIQDLRHWESDDSWIELFEDFYILGKMLGFTWEQIEQAYFDKNKVNHNRQATGY